MIHHGGVSMIHHGGGVSMIHHGGGVSMDIRATRLEGSCMS